MKCPNCNKKINLKLKFCPYCGKMISKTKLKGKKSGISTREYTRPSKIYSLTKNEERYLIRKIDSLIMNFEEQINSINHIDNYKKLIFTGEKICDSMLELYTKKLGYNIPESEMFYFLLEKDLIPTEAIEFIEVVLDFHESRRLQKDPSYEFLYSFLNAFNYFFLWFNEIYSESFSVEDPFDIYKISNLIYNLPNHEEKVSEVIGKEKIDFKEIRNEEKLLDLVDDEDVLIELIRESAIVESSDKCMVLADIEYEEEGVCASKLEDDSFNDFGLDLSLEKSNNKNYSEELLLFLIKEVKEIKEAMRRMDDKLTDIQRQLNNISKQFSDYQKMVENQLNRVNSEDEKEGIIQGYIDVCVEQLKNFSEINSKNREYVREKRKLQSSFDDAWDKLSDESKTFLISSRLMFNEYIMIEEQIDYSGVCILLAKALEVETTKRFFTDFIEYLGKKFQKNYSRYHTALTFNRNNLLFEEKFSMGSIAYVLCYKSDDKITPKQKSNNKKLLMDYCRNCIFSNKNDDEIEILLEDYASSIEEVREKYRNPSAHRNKIQQGDAKACFDFIIDHEELLIKMLKSFDN